MNADQLFQQARDIVSHCGFCFVCSHDGAGQINSRVVEVLQVGEGLTVRFMTDARTRKALEVSQGKAITLAFLSAADRGYVSIGAMPHVSAENTLKQSLWKESLRTWFPNGPDDPCVVTVSCEPIWVELWSHMRGIAPDPLGLNAVRLTQRDGDWHAGHTFPAALQA